VARAFWIHLRFDTDRPAATEVQRVSFCQENMIDGRNKVGGGGCGFEIWDKLGCNLKLLVTILRSGIRFNFLSLGET
jgi:hypothetical protein